MDKKNEIKRKENKYNLGEEKMKENKKKLILVLFI